MNRGEIWEINLDPTVGAEINKSRPAVIVNRNSIGRLPLKIIVPVTEWDERFARAAWHVPLVPNGTNNLDKKSSADTFQVRSVSHDRFVRRIGDLSMTDMRRIDTALKISLNLD